MKKTIQDLSIGDSVYSQNGNEAPYEWEVILLSQCRMEVYLQGYGARFTSRKKEDLTSFKFIGDKENVGSDYYKVTFYTEKIDALKEYRKKLDNNIEDEYKKQKDFLKRIMDLVNKARAIDEEIAKEMLS